MPSARLVPDAWTIVITQEMTTSGLKFEPQAVEKGCFPAQISCFSQIDSKGLGNYGPEPSM